MKKTTKTLFLALTTFFASGSFSASDTQGNDNFPSRFRGRVDAPPYEVADTREPSVLTHKRVVVLSFGGTGYRTLAELEFLRGFYERSRQIRSQFYPDQEGIVGIDLRIRTTLIAGVSWGGAAALKCLAMKGEDYRYSLDEMVQTYPQDAAEIFHVPWTQRLNLFRGYALPLYDINRVETLHQRTFLNRDAGNQTKISELGRAQEVLILILDQATNQPKFIRSSLAKQHGGEDFDVWKVATAAMATPMYFGAPEIEHERSILHLRDAALYAPDPTWLAYKEMTEIFRYRTKDLLFISLGTGISARQETDRWPLNRQSLEDLIKGKMTAAEKVSDQLMQDAAIKEGFKYYKYQPILDPRRTQPDRHGIGQTRYLKELARDLLDQPSVIDLVKTLDEDIPNHRERSVFDTNSPE